MTEQISFTILSYVVFGFILIIGGYLFGKAFYKIYNGEAVLFKKTSTRIENGIFKFIGVEKEEEMSAKKYVISLVLFSLISFLILFIMFLIQGILTLNPNGLGNIEWSLAFNTAWSFVTNTNWQAYSGELTMSNFSQMFGLTVQNFISGAVGIAVLFALIRGFTRKESKTIGNFYVDIVRIILFMLPVCFIGALILVSEGVPQTFGSNVLYQGLDGSSGTIYLGPAASQIIIKQLFTNGGGFYGANSAYPLENPTILSNVFECACIVWIPIGLCFTFGLAIKNKEKTEKIKHKNQGIILLKAMTIIFVVCLIVTTVCEYIINLNLPENVKTIGNMEGKEVRLGISLSSLWAVITTAASNGSVNAMHDSFTSIGGMIPLFLMMLGEIVYGGVGSGLYGMIAFALLTVFIAGLMVGRTPEYVGKKIGSFDMKMVCLVILPPVLLTLLGSASSIILTSNSVVNSGAHGFSEILYAFASMANNNGSAFAGFNANTTFVNVFGGIIMVLVRFIPMIAIIFLASSLAKKKIVPETDGTLKTDNALFVGLLIAVILIIGALSFFPSLALGPLAEFFS